MNTELLSPCANMEGLKAAIRYGADALYLGGPMLQMRAASAGFSLEQLQEAVRYAHERGKRVYVTVNTLLKNSETDALAVYGQQLKDIGVDAAIVSDVGAIRILHRQVPCLELHVSTQASVMNYESALAYYDMGVKRIVLAREMSLPDIGELRSKLPQELQLEAFVHGAMCMAYSGRCLISSFMLDRSGNRGQCAQSCRWEYALMEQKRPGQYFPIEQEGEHSMILSSRDLCMIEHLEALEQAGVSSFKIEGRMKSEYYCAAVTNAYRMAMDGGDIAQCRQELETVSHRPYTTGFYLGELPDGHYNGGHCQQDWVFCAVVEDWHEGIVTLSQRNHMQAGDVLYPLSPGMIGGSFTLTGMVDGEGDPIDTAPRPLMLVRLPCDIPLSKGDMIRRRSR